MPSIFFYVSGHGFGHASRQIEIINALGPRLGAGWRTAVRTAAAPRLFERTVRVPSSLLPGACDTGVIQHDSLRLDEEQTARRAGEFYRTFDARTSAEAALLREYDARLVVTDAPPLACAAAAAAGARSIVISNFTWDWIYEGYTRAFEQLAPDALPIIREAYARAHAGWRLPMHGGFATVPGVEDLPFVARHSSRPRQNVLDGLGIPSNRPLVLASFGGFGVSALNLETLDALSHYTVLTTRWQEPDPPPRGVICIDEERMYALGFRYEDIVAAVDVVVTKPGYGIISECIGNNTAVLYTSRGHFVEYDVLVAEMPRYLRCAFVEQDALLAGKWREPLDRLLASPPAPEHTRTDGAEVVARKLLAELD